MTDDRLRAKQEKIQLEHDKWNDENKIAHTEDVVTAENSQLAGSNVEWKRFYEVIKELTNNMRN